MSRIKLVQGDTRPQVILSMTDKDTGQPIDVSAAGAFVLMKFRADGSTTILNELMATKLVGQLAEDGTIDTTNSTPGAGGRVMFSWPPGALDGEPGYYEGEVSITFADGTIQTVWGLLKFVIRADF